MSDVAAAVARLAAGAESWRSQPPQARAALALETARCVASAADEWVSGALAMKQADGFGADLASRAEETSTGPLATMRLLLITARVFTEVAKTGLPWLARTPHVLHAGGDAARVVVDVLPALGPTGSLHDGAIFAGHRAAVRCGVAGGIDAFMGAWREEIRRRPQGGGIAVVLGAGNVTGLAPADCISQIFEHGRAVFLKLHPLHAPLTAILRRALAPLVHAGMLEVHTGSVDVVAEVLSNSMVKHLHMTGGHSTFNAIVWGGGAGHGVPVLRQTITCELGNVTPWFIVPGRYTRRELSRQADLVAASIVNNTSFNCIATKLIVTARTWDQRESFLDIVRGRLESVRTRPGWYPGVKAAWETVTQQHAPSDGTLPWVFRTGVDPVTHPQFVEKEWFVPVAAEVPLDADSLEAFCGRVHDLVARLPGSLAASVTVPKDLDRHDAARAELLIEHLPFGTVAVNTWSALAYALGNVPWGGFPGGTLANPKSGVGFVHDPLCLPLVHNTILRGPLASRITPAWLPWHPHAAGLARGLVDVYSSMIHGGRGVWPLLRMLPAVLSGGS